MAETARTPAEIEARIAARRQALAETLDEIAVRVHPRTILGDARARAAQTVDSATSRAFTTAGRAAGTVRGQFVTEAGSPRLDRIVPLALLATATVGLLVLSSRRQRR